MHRPCIDCHAKKAAEKKKPEMMRCEWCHRESREVIDARDIELHRRTAGTGSPVLPPISQ